MLEILSQIVAIAGDLHGSGPLSTDSLGALASHLVSRTVRHSAETGSGASTLLFSHASGHHLVFALDSDTGSITNVRKSPLLRAERVIFIEGATQLTMPTYSFMHPLDAVLLDGPHAWPFPDLEYYHLYPHIAPGGMLAVDNIEIPTVRRMFDILRADKMWRLDEVASNTAFFTRTDQPTFPPYWDCWNEQGYNDAYPLPPFVRDR
jgi:predicted O-methyltransferase YrrM